MRNDNPTVSVTDRYVLILWFFCGIINRKKLWIILRDPFAGNISF
nr:MAG TPA: hypothetical protein [Caudoviricetes sp.]